MKDKLQPLPLVHIKKIEHRNGIQLMVLFDFNNRIKDLLRFELGYFYSKTHKGWYTLYNDKAISNIKKVFGNTVQYSFDNSILKENNISEIGAHLMLSEEKKIILRLFRTFLKRNLQNENALNLHYNFILNLVDYNQDKSINQISNNDVNLFLNNNNYNLKNKLVDQKMINTAIQLFKSFYPECKLNKIK